MAKKKGKRKKALGIDLTVVEVASRISKPYQTARNKMLAGDFGPSKYDAKTRVLTVKSGPVDAWLAAQTSSTDDSTS